MHNPSIHTFFLLAALATACQPKAQESIPTTEAASEATAKAPQLQPLEAKFVAGRILEGEQLQHRFTIKNAGDAPLHLEQAKASCGCTVAVIETKEIAPGAEGFIDVTFNSNGRRGHQVKTITVESDDPQSPKTILSLEADVVVAVGFAQNSVRADIEMGSQWTYSVNIDQMTDDEVTLGEPQSDLDGLTARLAPRTDGQKGAVCEISYTPKAQGDIRAHITLTTGLKNKPNIVLPIFGHVKGDLTFTPVHLTLNEQAPQGSVHISSQKTDFKVVSATEEGDRLAVEIVPETPNRAYELRISLKEPKTNASFHTRLKITTDAATAPTLELPVSFRVGAANDRRKQALQPNSFSPATGKKFQKNGNAPQPPKIPSKDFKRNGKRLPPPMNHAR